MGEQVTTDIARKPHRQLQKFFNTAGTAIDKTGASRKAVGITAPASLGGIEIAMGKVGDDGMLSFQHDLAGGETFTVYFYNELLKKIVPATNGWAPGSSDSTTYSKTVDQYGLATFKLPPKTPWFLKTGTTPVVNLIVSGQAHEANQNDDNTYNN